MHSNKVGIKPNKHSATHVRMHGDSDSFTGLLTRLTEFPRTGNQSKEKETLDRSHKTVDEKHIKSARAVILSAMLEAL